MKFVIKQNKVRYLIAKKGLTLKEFSNEIGFNKDYISLVISGKRNPSVILVKKISNSLGMNIEDLFEITGGDSYE